MASQAPDTKAFYGYLFKSDKTPTETLDALLRAIAQYIVWSPFSGEGWEEENMGSLRLTSSSGRLQRLATRMRLISRPRSSPRFTARRAATTTVRNPALPTPTLVSSSRSATRQSPSLTDTQQASSSRSPTIVSPTSGPTSAANIRSNPAQTTSSLPPYPPSPPGASSGGRPSRSSSTLLRTSHSSSTRCKTGNSNTRTQGRCSPRRCRLRRFRRSRIRRW